MILLSVPVPPGLSPLDNVYLFFSIAGILVSIALSILFFALSSNRGMACDVTNLTRSAPNEHTMNIKLWNSGRSSIQQVHYDKPITFDFGAGAVVQEVSVVDAKPNSIIPSVIVTKGVGKAEVGSEVPTASGGKEVIGIPMLSQGDEITLYLKVSGYAGIKSINARIADINTIIETPYDLGRNIMYAFYFTIAYALVFSALNIILALSGRGVLNQAYDMYVLAGIWVLMFTYSFKFKIKYWLLLWRMLLWISFVAVSYIGIHYTLIGFLPNFLFILK